MNDDWKIIDYDDIIKNKYEINSEGIVRNIKTGKILYGNNPKNEKGYKRVCLQTYSKPRKFSVHRLVMHMFNNEIGIGFEVNHKDCNKYNNNINNLEYVDRFGNAHHAADNHLYITCEDHHKSIFTNYQVEKICQLLSLGTPMNKIIKIMGFENIDFIKSYISRIKNRITWTEISYKYEWDDDEIIYKTYKKSDIEKMCECLFKFNYSIREVLLLFPNYDNKKLRNVLKKIKQKKLYKSISKKYWNDSSTTIESDDDMYYIDITL